MTTQLTIEVDVQGGRARDVIVALLAAAFEIAEAAGTMQPDFVARLACRMADAAEAC
jgi:hypothetical protein